MPAAPHLGKGAARAAPQILDVLLGIEVDIEHVGIVAGQGLRDIGIHERRAAGAFIVLRRHDVLMLDAHHVRHILADAQHAGAPLGVDVFQLGGLQLALLFSGCVRHVLKEDIGSVHRDGDPVVPDEVVRRLGVENLGIRQADHALRRLFMGIVGKGLVAGQINPGFGILGKGHAGHVVQQRCDGLFQFRDLPGVLDLVLGLGQAFSERLRIPVVVQHHRHHEQEQPQGDNAVHRVRPADRVGLFLQIGGSLCLDVGVRVVRRMAFMVFQNALDRLFGRGPGGAGNPHHRREQHQHQQQNPDNHAFTEFALFIPPDQAAEVRKAQQRPHDEQHVRLRLHRVEGQQPGDEQQQREHSHQQKAEHARRLLRPAVLPLSVAEDRMRDQAIDDRGAQRCDVDDPADGRSAQEGNEEGNRDHDPDGRGRNAAPVQPGKGPGHLPFPSRREQQAAQGQQVADQAGQDHAEQRQHQHRDAETAEIVIRRVEGRHGLDALEVSHVADILQPAAVLGRIGRHRQQGHEQV